MKIQRKHIGTPNKLRQEILKLKLNKYPYQTILFLISLALIVWSIIVYYENLNLEESGQIKKYGIIDRYCNKSFKRSSSISFQTEQGVNDIEIPNFKMCNSYKDSIELVYSSNFNYYYLPNSIWKYKRYIIGSFIVLVVSILPWIRIKNYFDSFFKIK